MGAVFLVVMLDCAAEPKVLRDEFKYSPKINRTQFFSAGYAEQKMILTTEVIKRSHEKHTELERMAKSRVSERTTRHALKSARTLMVPSTPLLFLFVRSSEDGTPKNCPQSSRSFATFFFLGLL